MGKVKIWFLHNGCAVPILGVDPKLLGEWERKENFAKTDLYKTYLLPKLNDVKAKLASGELEITPQRMRSDFMQMR